MANRNVYRESLETTIANLDILINFDRVTTWSGEWYGADADGNRGVWTNTIDEDRAEDVEVIVGDARPLPLSAFVSPLQSRLQDAIEKHLDTTEPVYQEPDYDDIDD